MIKQSERIQMSLQRMREVVFNHHQASIVEPPQDPRYRPMNGYDDNASNYGDDTKGMGGFAGGDNNQMLRVIQECRGKFPKRVIIRSTLADKHFIGGDPEYVFVSQERDKITGNTTMKQLNFNKTTPGRDLRARLTANTRTMSPAELKEVHHFIDLLEKCLQLDPARRITPNDALRHPFIQHTQPTAATATKKMKPAMAPLERR